MSDDMADVTNNVRVSSTEKDGVVVATITKAKFTDRNKLRLKYELRNGDTGSEYFSVPAHWNETHRYVRLVQLDDAPWDPNNFTTDSVERANIEVHKEGGDWQAHLPHTASRRERVVGNIRERDLSETLMVIIMWISGLFLLLASSTALVNFLVDVLGGLI